MKNLSTIFKALSDETRLAMLALLLCHEELCVCDFVEVLGITQSKASRHLRYLLHAGLLEDRRDTVWVHYRIRPLLSAEAGQVIEAVRPLLDGPMSAELAQRLERWLQAKRREGAGCPAPAKRQPSSDASGQAPARQGARRRQSGRPRRGKSRRTKARKENRP